MRNLDHGKIAAALAAAADAAGVGRLLALLGYELIEPPAGTSLDDGVVRIACGMGLDVLCLEADEGVGAADRAARLRALVGGTPRPLLLVWPGAAAVTFATGGLDGRARASTMSRVAPRASELETIAELAVRDEGALPALSRHARALDKASLTRRFFRDFRAQRDAIAASWRGLPAGARDDRNQLALLFLSRIVFLYFLQKQGQLLGRADYLVSLVRAASLETETRSIFARVFRPLFFGALNRPFDDRAAEARALGPLPYLNGGLFEPHALERRHTDLDLPDDAVLRVFDALFERYRFTASENAGNDATVPGIEPEMLGRMFEGLMAADRRERTGTFYTPAAVVDRVVKHALQGWLGGRPGLDWRAAGMLLRERAPAYAVNPALLGDVQGLRVIDPACGSGAFVLGALERLGRLRRQLGDAAQEDAVRRDVAANALHGVDVEADAALLCALRLWLALAPAEHSGAPVRPLPNLDHRVRQGDALLDPLDLAARGDSGAEVWRSAALDPKVRRCRQLLAALLREYGSASATQRAALRERIGRTEVRLARRWIAGALDRLDRERRARHARARTRDLFGHVPDPRSHRAELRRLRDARLELSRLARRLQDEKAIPFFSFALHFAPS
ncbi:MAG TPA: DNA methyltransferase, partial [Thermoanaerobaculia bacterium]